MSAIPPVRRASRGQPRSDHAHGAELPNRNVHARRGRSDDTRSAGEWDIPVPREIAAALTSSAVPCAMTIRITLEPKEDERYARWSAGSRWAGISTSLTDTDVGATMRSAPGAIPSTATGSQRFRSVLCGSSEDRYGAFGDVPFPGTPLQDFEHFLRNGRLVIHSQSSPEAVGSIALRKG